MRPFYLNFLRIRQLMAFLFLLPFYFLFLSLKTSVPVELSITHIRSEKGQFVIAIHKDADSFEKKVPHQKFVVKKSNIKNGVQKVIIHLEPGVYGISLLDDEDSDTKMNYNFMGMPTEGFGFPNYYHTGYSKPTFNDFKLTVTSKPGQNFVVKLRYI